jgi:hypothetical protein
MDSCSPAEPARKPGRWGLGITPAVTKRCHWVEPLLIAQITFTEWTGDGGQSKRLLNSAFRGSSHPDFWTCGIQGGVRFDGGWLFVSLERGIDRALELAQEGETKEHSQKSRLGVAR